MNVVSHNHLYHMTTVVAIYLSVVNSTCEALNKALHNWTIGNSPDSLLWESGARLGILCNLKLSAMGQTMFTKKNLNVYYSQCMRLIMLAHIIVT